MLYWQSDELSYDRGVIYAAARSGYATVSGNNHTLLQQYIYLVAEANMSRRRVVESTSLDT